MLAVVLLTVIAPPLSIDTPPNPVCLEPAFCEVEDLPVGLHYRHDAHPVQLARVPRLSAALGVEGGAVEDHRWLPIVLAPCHDDCVELEKVGVVAMEENSPHQRAAMLSTYLRPVPVLKTTTVSSGLRWPEALSLRRAATQAPPSGHTKRPSRAEASLTP